MASQWDPRNFKPLDMSEILGYPRQMPLRYENYPPDASITSMDQLEETVLEKWGIKLEYIHVLIKILEYMKQTKNETVKEFHTRFENLVQQIPRSHCPEDMYLAYLYTNALLVHLGFLLSKKGPRTIQEAYHMAIQIEANISLFKQEHLFTPETKVDDPKDTPDALILEILVSLEKFVSKFEEIREQFIDQ